MPIDISGAGINPEAEYAPPVAEPVIVPEMQSAIAIEEEM